MWAVVLLTYSIHHVLKRMISGKISYGCTVNSLKVGKKCLFVFHQTGENVNHVSEDSSVLRYDTI